MEDLHLPSAACRYANQPVTLQHIPSPQDHFRTYIRVWPSSASGTPVEGAEPENLYVDGGTDRANVEDYFSRGGGVVRLRCRSSGSYQRGDGLSTE